MIYFVTPAWQRFALSEVCFAQRRHVIDTLAGKGIEARCVVIADDENLDLARAQGFDVVEQSNEGLGRKFNDGMEYAGAHGADWIVPIGSDSWIDPAYFLPLPSNGVTRTSQLYSVVTADRLGEVRVRTRAGAGPYMLHRSHLAPSFRPASDALLRHVDSSTIKGLSGIPGWRHQHLNPFQYIGFRGTPTITPYGRLMKRWGVREHRDPWAILTRHYPADLVERARTALAGAPA
jgi:glycosyltransferase involved in cell wall biosynthesis